MKVLWFSNSPANADEYFNLVLKGTGGWLKSLDQSLQLHLELHIAFYSKDDKTFKFLETNYHPIKSDQSKFKKALKRFVNHVPNEEDLDKYLKIVNRVKPDIIHIHGTEKAFACIISHTDIPVVLSIQGNITIYFHKFLSGFEKAYLKISNRNFISIENLLFPQKFFLTYRLFKKMQKREKKYLKITKYIIGRTLWDKRITRIQAPDSKYYHGDEILRDLFYQTQWTPNFRNKIIIHTTTSNIFYKGFETLCLALYELNTIGINCEWHVAGIQCTDLLVKITKKKLRNKFPKIGLILMGNLDEKALVKSLLEADVYVMPSHIENSPNTLCEAMILGMPCISTFAGGTGSLLKDGVEGILVQDGDPWAMAGAVLELINNKEKAIQFGRNAQAIALLRHDKNRIVDSLLETYNCIINEN